MKNLFKKKGKFPTPVEPRDGETIKREYYEMRAKAGDTQYQLSVFGDELRQINNRMRELNQEMNTRNALDKAAAKTKETKEVKNESV